MNVRISLQDWTAAITCAAILTAPLGMAGQTPTTAGAAAAQAGAASTMPTKTKQTKSTADRQENGAADANGPSGVEAPVQLAWPVQDFSGNPKLPILRPVNAPPPPLGRPRIGLALGGGSALALSEIGVLRWFDENHIPVDAIAGTSMGSLVGALYATGHSPAQMEELTSDRVFSKVFRLDTDFRQLNFRRRTDARFLPGGFNIGLKHGVSFRNGVLLDYGLNEFLNAQFLPYYADYSFDNMPIPFRCVATDILVGREAIFTKGPLAEAVRASVSIPGVFPPLEDGGHTYVDGALTENLPVDAVKTDLHADKVIAVSLPLTPPDVGDTNSLLGVLQRSFSVAAWSNEVRSRKMADLVIQPVAPTGVGAADYAQSRQLAQAGYEAAEKMRPQLMAYRLTDAQWAEYIAQRKARFSGYLGNVARVNVLASTHSTANGVRNTAVSLAGQPLNPQKIDVAEDEVRSDGRYQADYFLTKPGQPVNLRVTGPANVGRNVQGRELLHPEEKRGPGDDIAAEDYGQGVAETPQTAGEKGQAISNRTVNNTIPVGSREPKSDKKDDKPKYETIAPSSAGPIVVATATAPGYVPKPNDYDLNLWVHDKPFGPPFLLLGGNIIAQSGGVARATLDAVLTEQDLGGYRSEFRTTMRFGFLTDVVPEYYRRLTAGGLFIAPRLQFLQQPVYIWANQRKIAERQQQNAGGGVDIGYSISHYTEIRAGWQEVSNAWHLETGSDGLPSYNGQQNLARVLYRFNGQDRALIPLHGLRAELNAGYQFNTVQSENAPRITGLASYFRAIGHGNTLAIYGEGGTMANRNIADAFRFTLGGPLRLSASAFDEYRGTDYWFVRPSYFRRIASLPAVLGQSIYLIGSYEAGQMRSPTASTVTRQDVFFGLAAETPLGAITLGPAIGDDDHRKLVFTLGRFF